MAAFQTSFEVRLDPSTVYLALSQPENLSFLLPGVETARLLQGDGGQASLLDLILEGERHVYGWVQRAEPGVAWEVVDQDGCRALVELHEADGKTVAHLTVEVDRSSLDPSSLGSRVRSRLAKLLVALEARYP